MKINTAVILAAGVGSRFGKYTKERPKGFVEVGGTPMVEQSIINLIDVGIINIIIGVGYHSEFYEDLASKYPQIKFIQNKKYADTNSMYTLFCCNDLIENDFLLLESDLIYEKRALICLIENQHNDIVLVSQFVKNRDAYYVETDSDHNLLNCGTDLNKLNLAYGEFVGIHRISYSLYKKLYVWYNEIAEKQPKLGYEYALAEASNTFHKIFVHKEDGLIWYEIDDEVDLLYATENILPKMR